MNEVIQQAVLDHEVNHEYASLDHEVNLDLAAFDHEVNADQTVRVPRVGRA